MPPWARRRGVSQLLFAALGRAAHAAVCARLQWSVLAWNTAAVDTYEAMGAERLEEWRLYRLYADGIARLAAGAVRAGPPAAAAGSAGGDAAAAAAAAAATAAADT